MKIAYYAWVPSGCKMVQGLQLTDFVIAGELFHCAKIKMYVIYPVEKQWGFMLEGILSGVM